MIINRLRAGHSLATHGYLMDDTVPDIPPVCGGCQDAVLTVKHIMLECTAYQAQRQRMRIFRNTPQVTLEELLGDKICVEEVMVYLRAISLYDCI